VTDLEWQKLRGRTRPVAATATATNAHTSTIRNPISPSRWIREQRADYLHVPSSGSFSASEAAADASQSLRPKLSSPRGRARRGVAGRRFDAPFTTIIQELTANPLDSDRGYSGRIVAVEQTGDGAVVTLEESGCWANLSFIDYFTLRSSATL
jgi:hypothetical protein